MKNKLFAIICIMFLAILTGCTNDKFGFMSSGRLIRPVLSSWIATKSMSQPESDKGGQIAVIPISENPGDSLFMIVYEKDMPEIFHEEPATKGTEVTTSNLNAFRMKAYAEHDWHDNATNTDHQAGEYFGVSTEVTVSRSSSEGTMSPEQKWLNELNEIDVHDVPLRLVADESAHTTIHIVGLEGTIYGKLARHFKQPAVQFRLTHRITSHGELYAGTRLLLRVLYALSAREALYGVDVEALLGNEPGDSLNLSGLQLTAQHGEDVAVLALSAYPVLVLLHRDRVELDVDAQFAGFEEEFFHDAATVVLGHTDEDAQREGGMDIGLADVLDMHVITT